MIISSRTVLRIILRTGLLIVIFANPIVPAAFNMTAFNAAAQKIPENAEEIRLSFAPLVKKAAPSVVNIYAKRIVTERAPLFSDPFFQRFFDDSFQSELGGNVRKRIANSLGSGVILQPDGLIVTNAHVVEGAEEIIVVLADRREYEAELLLKDERTDLAILQIQAKEALPFLPFGDSDEINVGDLVIAIGNPFSVGQSVTSGIVSALARSPLGISDFRSFIQTDAAINPGNSGGALINHRGVLIGINTAIFSRSGESLGIGFAVPANMVRLVATNAAEGKEIIRPWTGLSGQDIDWDIAQALSMKYPGGMLVENIHPTSPAARAGMKMRDVVTHIDGYKFETLQDLRFRLALKPSSSKLQLSGFRSGKKRNWQLQLEPPPENPPRERVELEGKHVLSGAVLENLSPKIADEIGFDLFTEGVVMRGIKRTSLANRYGFKPGDILRTINGHNIASTKDARLALENPTSSYTIIVERDGKRLKKTFR